MDQPVVSWPSSYDTLFSALVNTRVFSVKSYVDVDALHVVVNEDLTGIDGPLYLVFEGGEIWYVGEDSVSQNGDLDWVFAVETHASQRAVNGSPLQIHVTGEKIYVGLMAHHLNLLRDVAIATQKQKFLAGLEADIPVAPLVGQRYLCTDSKKIFYCFSVGTWTWINRTKHAFMLGLADDDHPQYMTETEAASFHNGLSGGHVVGGEDHDHTSANQGGAVAAIRAGTDSVKGSPEVSGDAFFSTDVSGGSLFISADGSTWEQLGGVPSGAIVPFTGACPSGWVRYTALDGRFPRAAASHGTVGGSATHTHTYTDQMQHFHTVSGGSVSLDSAGSHTHGVRTKSGSGGVSALAVFGGNTTVSSYQSGEHSHSVSVPERTLATVGVSPATTDAASSLPPYQEVVFCKKA